MSPQALASLLVAGLINLLLVCSVNADQNRFPVADDLYKLGAEAEKRELPILLLISQYHCEYCERIKREVLQPMQTNKDFQNRVLVGELMIDAGEKVVDFQGKQVESAAFSQRYGVFVTPTLLFLDNQGREAAERILGINTLDYLVFYIEDAIEKATKKSFGK
ncbi:MAG: thioredoxin fold domain-containing protein [Candidatus Thiodiazotropha sp. 6PLUC9]